MSFRQKPGMFGVPSEERKDSEESPEHKKMDLAAENLIKNGILRLNSELEEALRNNPKGRGTKIFKKVFEDYFYDTYTNKDYDIYALTEDQRKRIEEGLQKTLKLLDAILSLYPGHPEDKKLTEQEKDDKMQYLLVVIKIDALLKQVKNVTYKPPSMGGSINS